MHDNLDTLKVVHIFQQIILKFAEIVTHVTQKGWCNMTDISTENNVQKGNTPLEQGKKSLEEMFKEHKKPLMSLTFISTYYINKIDEYLMPKQDKFLFQRWNRTFLINKSAKKITLKLLANFVVTEVRECTLVYNDLSNKKPSKYYIINLKNDKGRIEKMLKLPIIQSLILGFLKRQLIIF